MKMLNIGGIGRTYRHAQRYRQILTVLFRNGFGDLVDGLHIEQYLEIGLQMVSRTKRERVQTLSRAQRVRMVLEELGPTFVKMGQILSTRADLLPAEYLRELELLQDNVRPFAFSEAAEVIGAEFGVPLDEVFDEITETPLASASLGQVHRARLTDGREVVIKVQRPRIRKTIEIDLEIMIHLASLMETHLEDAEIHQPTRIIEEFARTLEKELDFSIEASYVERFASNFVNNPTVHVPTIHHHASTSRVLTMEYVDGIKASDLARMEREGIDARAVARTGADLIMEQIFVHGFFHGDPHPGNILVLPGNVICLLDFGMMGRISRKTREDFSDLILALALRNEVKAAQALIRLTETDQEPDYNRLQLDVADFMDQHFHRPLKEMSLGRLLYQLLDLAARHRLRIPPELFLMLKSLSIVESLGRTLDPDFDIAAHAAPFLRRLQMERGHPRRIASDLYDFGTQLTHLLEEVPGEVRAILRQARQGKVRVEFEHRGLEPMLSTHNRISNRIAFAIVLASLVVGSSLIVLSGVPPRWHEIPVIGLSGFIVAGVMSLWLLFSIMRGGRL